jgi:hypothetical protein
MGILTDLGTSLGGPLARRDNQERIDRTSFHGNVVVTKSNLVRLFRIIFSGRFAVISLRAKHFDV